MIPNPTSTVEAFEARHGLSYFDAENYIILFEDGATRDANPFGMLREPPTDPLELARRKLNFWRKVTADAENLFQRQKEQFERGNPGIYRREGGGFEDNAYTPEHKERVLKSLRARVCRYRIRFKKAQERYEALAPKRTQATAPASTFSDINI